MRYIEYSKLLECKESVIIYYQFLLETVKSYSSDLYYIREINIKLDKKL